MFSRDYKINKMSENIKSTKREIEEDKTKSLISYETIKNLWANDENYTKYKRKTREKSKEKTKAVKEM